MNSSPLSRLNEPVKPGKVLADHNFSVAWQSPSNIALVKYWGKRDGQFPATPSLSMTLAKAVTQTRIQVLAGEKALGLISVNGDEKHPFMPKMQHLLQCMACEIPVLNNLAFTVATKNSFPHSTGIASSASGLSAFALCLIDVACEILNAGISEEERLHMASYSSRMGSGSACRSVYGGFALWGETDSVTGSSDEFAIPVKDLVHPEMMQLHDAILVISGKPKSLPSTLGHRSMYGHPFFSGRIGQANQNLADVLQALASTDFERLSLLTETEALTLHALIMSASPGTMLMKPATVEAIHRVREARAGGLPVFFTLDAGANVHVMYPGNSVPIVEEFIRDALQPLCEDEQVIFDYCGNGPEKLNQTRVIS
jgi:diphosphomevalonate decarboxylase